MNSSSTTPERGKEVEPDFYQGKAGYIGDEFPEHYGRLCDVWDDHSNPNCPCYKIQFKGSSEIIQNIDDGDISFL